MSGRPFNARLVDVAREAGLREPIVYGPVETKKYILETIGCGCAFFDYDNDGWMDVFILGGTRLDGDPPGATNRLYKNNRDGTFTDVTAQAGLVAAGWASGVCVGDYNNDGFEDLFCTRLRPEPALSQQRRRDVHRRDEGGRALERGAALGGRLQLRRLRPRRTPGSVRLELHPVRRRAGAGARREQQLQLEGHSRGVRAARPPARPARALSEQRRRHVHGRERAGGHRRRDARAMA